MLYALAAAAGIAGWAIPWKLAAAEGPANANALLLLAFAALFSTVYDRVRPGPHRAFTRVDWAIAAGLAALTLTGNLASAHAIQGLSPALARLPVRVSAASPAAIAQSTRVKARCGPGRTRS